MSKEPQLPEFNNSDLIKVETEHHVVEIEKREMAKLCIICKENIYQSHFGITSSKKNLKKNLII